MYDIIHIMITTTQKIEELINRSPYLREAITDGLINLSALARKLQPTIRAELVNDVTEGAILIALQRYGRTLAPFYTANPAQFLGNMGLRSDLVELTVKNSATLLARLTQVAGSIEHHSLTFVFTQGQYETTIIMSRRLQENLTSYLQGEDIVHTIAALTGITLERTPGQIERTGVLQFPLRILAWEGISVIEIITTMNEIMIIVRDFEVDRAVASIRQGLAGLRGV